MSREMKALKSQMAELKNMLKLSLDIQRDTQRAIRQEVAAALATALGQFPAATLFVFTAIEIDDKNNNDKCDTMLNPTVINFLTYI